MRSAGLGILPIGSVGIVSGVDRSSRVRCACSVTSMAVPQAIGPIGTFCQLDVLAALTWSKRSRPPRSHARRRSRQGDSGVETSGALPPVQRSDCCRAGTSSGRATVSLERAGGRMSCLLRTAAPTLSRRLGAAALRAVGEEPLRLRAPGRRGAGAPLEGRIAVAGALERGEQIGGVVHVELLEPREGGDLVHTRALCQGL